jgi:HSP20 family protein
MEKQTKGSPFLSGFGNENIIEEHYTGKSQNLTPGTILSESDEVYKIELGIPFLRKEDITVEFHNDRLIVKGHRSTPAEIKEDSKNYNGIFQVPQNVQTDKIYSIFKDDLLTVVLPKQKVIVHSQESYTRT